MIQNGALQENHLFHFFWEIRSETKLQHLFSAVSSALFLAGFERRCSDTTATLRESMFYKKGVGIIDQSCHIPYALQKIIFHHSARHDIIEKLFSFNLVINLSIS